MTGGLAIASVALLLLLIVVRTVFVVGVVACRFGRWLFEQPEGIAGAAGRLAIAAVLLHQMGLL
jgi:hypothetical protein